MGAICVIGATCTCGFGTAPASIANASQTSVLMDGKPALTITDFPTGNFGQCISMTNPTTAAQTAAALGVLTPAACTPVPAMSWIGGNPMHMAGGKPLLTSDCSLACMFAPGGMMSVTNPGQVKVAE